MNSFEEATLQMVAMTIQRAADQNARVISSGVVNTGNKAIQITFTAETSVFGKTLFPEDEDGNYDQTTFHDGDPSSVPNNVPVQSSVVALIKQQVKG